jgi:hypothetical protein
LINSASAVQTVSTKIVSIYPLNKLTYTYDKGDTIKRCVSVRTLFINSICTGFADIFLLISKKGSNRQFITLVGDCVFWDITIEVIDSMFVMHKNESQKLKQKRAKGMNKWREGELK